MYRTGVIHPHPNPLPLGEVESFAAAVNDLRLESPDDLKCNRSWPNAVPSPSGIQLLGFSQSKIKVLRLDEQPKLRHRKPCPTTVNTYGEKLRIKRLEMALTQPEMAAMLGVSKFRLGLWERGYSRPSAVEQSNLVGLLNSSGTMK